MDLPAAAMVSQPRPVRGAFTLIELLKVIAVILLQAGMIIGTVAEVRLRARQTSTSLRMQVVLDALINYDNIDGSSALSLQSHLPIGGVVSFATVKAIDDAAQTGSVPPPPGFTYVYYNGGWQTTLLTTSNYQAGINNEESALFFRRQEASVFDVMPTSLASVTSAAVYQNWWPGQWPPTDWMALSPGTTPPILRFPWGKQGMRIDGTLCDASIPVGVFTSANPQQFLELTHSAGVMTSVHETMANAWATSGNSLASDGNVWAWNNASTNQTDWVTMTGATRSDGTILNATQAAANLPMPYDLGYLSPMQTIAFLQAANVLSATTGANDYRTNRSTTAAWNDAWGNPLIVVYAIFQPERYNRVFDGQNRRDLLLRSATENYQFNRAIYLAVASAGPTLPATTPLTWTPSGDALTLQQYWMQIRTVCNAVDWNETSFNNPPWQGVRISTKKISGVSYTCQLTAPTVVK
jgi:type II secretory pathway pseudopilin PulG